MIGTGLTRVLTHRLGCRYPDQKPGLSTWGRTRQERPHALSPVRRNQVPLLEVPLFEVDAAAVALPAAEAGSPVLVADGEADASVEAGSADVDPVAAAVDALALSGVDELALSGVDALADGVALCSEALVAGSGAEGVVAVLVVAAGAVVAAADAAVGADVVVAVVVAVVAAATVVAGAAVLLTEVAAGA
jgi:hypothetical protein